MFKLFGHDHLVEVRLLYHKIKAMFLKEQRFNNNYGRIKIALMLVLLQTCRPTLSWSSCSLLAFSQTLSTFCRSTEASMYCTHSCSRRESLKLRASLYTSMINRTSWTWPGGATTDRAKCLLCWQFHLKPEKHADHQERGTSARILDFVCVEELH